ncbi:MAG TPA: hypothetical protein VG937_16095 [Polyangiaceae bacterium]|nr:hypothetical protein [Polyangiaceae bacterium]
MTPEGARELAALLVQFFETGSPPPELFANDVFCDLSLPRWRRQAQGIPALVAMRLRGHPNPGKVPRWRCDPTPTGFVLEFEERWKQNGHDWYAREIARADVTDGKVSALSVYCTGDWDEERRIQHAAEVTLLRN